MLKIDEINPNVSMSIDCKNYYAGYSLIIMAMIDLDVDVVKMILNHPKFDNQYQDCDRITPYIHVFHNKMSMSDYSSKEEAENAFNSLVKKSNSVTSQELFDKYMSMIVHPSTIRLPRNKRIRYIDETHDSDSD